MDDGVEWLRGWCAGVLSGWWGGVVGLMVEWGG